MGLFLLDRVRAPGIRAVHKDASRTSEATVANAQKNDQANPNNAYLAYCTDLGIDPEKGTTSFDERVRRDYRWHTVQYWFVASLANGLLWAQIVIGAALTALGATGGQRAKTATIYLGASSTVIAGLLTYFKSRNQPNRTRQFRQALKNVRNKIDEAAGEIRLTNDPTAARLQAIEIIKMYDEALSTAENNYPDLWVTRKNRIDDEAGPPDLSTLPDGSSSDQPDPSNRPNSNPTNQRPNQDQPSVDTKTEINNEKLTEKPDDHSVTGASQFRNSEKPTLDSPPIDKTPITLPHSDSIAPIEPLNSNPDTSNLRSAAATLAGSETNRLTGTTLNSGASSEAK